VAWYDVLDKKPLAAFRQTREEPAPARGFALGEESYQKQNQHSLTEAPQFHTLANNQFVALVPPGRTWGIGDVCLGNPAGG
jgi:hypothetical protein